MENQHYLRYQYYPRIFHVDNVSGEKWNENYYLQRHSMTDDNGTKKYKNSITLRSTHKTDIKY